MAKIAITLKVLFVWLYHGFASLLIQGAVESSVDDGVMTPIQLYPLIWFSLIMIFLPEIMFVSWPVFRKWIMAGAEDGDGILHSKDLKELGVLYISLWSMRIFMGFSIAVMFGSEIPLLIYLSPLVGSFGTAGLAIIKGVIGKKLDTSKT